jgi:hypothetical protein
MTTNQFVFIVGSILMGIGGVSLLTLSLISAVWLSPEADRIHENLKGPLYATRKSKSTATAIQNLRKALRWMVEAGLKTDFNSYYAHLHACWRFLETRKDESGLTMRGNLLWIRSELIIHEDWPIPKKMKTHRVRLPNTIHSILVVIAFFSLIIGMIFLATSLTPFHYHR